MKIIIEFDQATNTFLVQFDRGLAVQLSEDPIPPPPWNDQIEAMTTWLNKTYPSVLEKFKDREVSGLQLTCQVPPK